MKIATWNIRSGGGRRLPAIAERILAEDASLMLLTEFRTEPGRRLLELLALGDRHHVLATEPPKNANGLLALSTTPFEHAQCPIVPPASCHRWLRFRLPVWDLEVLGVHVPNMGEPWNKAEYWDCLLRFAEWAKDRRALVLGDFNTGLPADTQGAPFHLGDRMQRLIDLGWIDTWRAVHGEHTEYTWLSPNAGNGFRLDHCFVSPALAGDVERVAFGHDVRLNGLSDHSLLSIRLGITAAN